MDKRMVLLNQFEDDNADRIFNYYQYLESHPIIITSDRDAVRKVKQYFPTFDDSDTERIRKNVTITYLRKQEPYKEAFEKECRRQWLKQSLDIYQMLLDSNRLESELRSGLKFEPVEDKAHAEFYLAYISTSSKIPANARIASGVPTRHRKRIPANLFRPTSLNRIKWEIVDKYQDQVEL